MVQINKKVLCFFFFRKRRPSFLYAVFMLRASLPCRGFMRRGANQALKGRWPMGDALTVIYGIFVFVLLILYVKGCEKV